MEEFIPVIILVIVVFWSVISKVIGAARRLFPTGEQFQVMNLVPENREPARNVRTVTETATGQSASGWPGEEVVIELDDTDFIEPGGRSAPEKTVDVPVAFTEGKRHKLRKAIIWSEILAPPLALREKRTEL